MLAGTLVTIAGFVPVGFAASSAGEYTFSLFAVVAIALIVSWFVAVIFAPLLGVVILKAPKASKTADPGKIFLLYRRFLTLAMRAKWVTIFLSIGALRRLVSCPSADPPAVLSFVRPAGIARRPQLAAERLDLCQRNHRETF